MTDATCSSSSRRVSSGDPLDPDGAGATRRDAGKGTNLGWDDCEGTLEFEADEGHADDLCGLHALPVFDVAHASDACSVIGGRIHRGPDSVEWRGLYVAGDRCGRLFVLGPAGRLRFSAVTDERITSIGADRAGRMLVTSLDGRVQRVRFR
jgi:hypothetical protein